MKEFMFFIRKQADSAKTLPADKHTEFLKSCESYIGMLKAERKLVSAQPIERTGAILSRVNDEWTESPFNENREVIGGYYHIMARDLDEAINIAKANPEFTYNPGTRIEVRGIKTNEEQTGFVYPSR
jgi:hypothetical protein